MTIGESCPNRVERLALGLRYRELANGSWHWIRHKWINCAQPKHARCYICGFTAGWVPVLQNNFPEKNKFALCTLPFFFYLWNSKSSNRRLYNNVFTRNLFTGVELIDVCYLPTLWMVSLMLQIFPNNKRTQRDKGILPSPIHHDFEWKWVMLVH